MSGRRSKKIKYYSRSYSKPLFDPQRLLYFSTTNQRLGKVIRPKSSAIRNNPTIKKEQVQDVFTDLNETKSFRIEDEKKNGKPVCLFHQHDEYESIDFDPLYNYLTNLCCVSFPLTSLKPTEHLDRFVKNFQPYTPSLCYPIRLLQRVSISLANVKQNDKIHYQVYIIDKSQLENIGALPGEAALEALLNYRLYNLTIDLNGANKPQMDIEADFTDFLYWLSGESPNQISNYRFKLPQAETMQIEENRVYFPATDRDFPSNTLPEMMNDLLSAYLLQQTEKYSIWRYPPPATEFTRISLVKDLFEVNKLPERIDAGEIDDVYMFSYCYLERPSQDASPMECEYMFSVEGYEVNPVLSAQ